MQALAEYLADIGASVESFARTIAIDAGDLKEMLAGNAPVDYAVALRIVDMTDGAVALTDLIDDSGVVVDLRRRAAAGASEIDPEALERIFAEMLPSLIGGASRKGDELLPRLAADAVTRAYAALSTVTTRRNADRLVQALLPVVEEILAELASTPGRREAAGPFAQRAAERYLRMAPPLR